MIDTNILGDLYRIIPQGAKNAKNLKALSTYFGTSSRHIKKCINILRTEYQVPIVSTSQGGYFKPAEDSDKDVAAARRFVSMQEQQAKSRFMSAKAVREWLDEVDNSKQVTIEECRNG